MKKVSRATYLNATLSYCPYCGTTELARIVARDSGVYLERMCPERGTEATKIAADPRWYQSRTREIVPAATNADTLPSRHGCPHDCGPCAKHSAALALPVFSITNDCNLDCPKCFTYNRPDRKYYKSVAEARRIAETILKQSGGCVQLINITGGEPTLHPHLFDIIAVFKRKGIGRITMNTNGLRLASDDRLAARIKESGVQVVLSLDTLQPGRSRRIYGKDISALKKKALRVLERHAIPTTILSVCMKGINEDEVAGFATTYLRKDFVRSMTIQNMTFTGKNGSDFTPREHITLDEVEGLLAETGCFSRTDFFTPGSYHPLCYSSAYYLVVQDIFIPLTRFIEPPAIREMMREKYVLEENAELHRRFLDGINHLWASGTDAALMTRVRKVMRSFGERPAGRSARSVVERSIKMICIHPHMDEDNFDIDRVSRCGDLVPDESGRLVPACSYNLLYRQKDPRFWKE